MILSKRSLAFKCPTICDSVEICADTVERIERERETQQAQQKQFNGGIYDTNRGGIGARYLHVSHK